MSIWDYVTLVAAALALIAVVLWRRSRSVLSQAVLRPRGQARPAARAAGAVRKVGEEELPLGSGFKVIVWVVLLLTLLSLGVAVYLITRPSVPARAEPVIDGCMTAFKMGFGAFVGLIGGKAIK